MAEREAFPLALTGNSDSMRRMSGACHSRATSEAQKFAPLAQFAEGGVFAVRWAGGGFIVPRRHGTDGLEAESNLAS